MARSVVYEHRIKVGSPYHSYTCGDPPDPLPRYTVVRTLFLNGEWAEGPDEWELSICLPDVYLDRRVAYDLCDALNTEWHKTDTRHPTYVPGYAPNLPDQPPQPLVTKTFTCHQCKGDVTGELPIYHGSVDVTCPSCGLTHDVRANWPHGHQAMSPERGTRQGGR